MIKSNPANPDNRSDWLQQSGLADALACGDGPLYSRIASLIRQGILEGHLPDRTKLPTTRELAALLRVDRSTASRAYQELERLRLVSMEVGRGTFVQRQEGSPGCEAMGDRGAAPGPTWSDKFSRASNAAAGLLARQPALTAPQEGMVSFAGGVPTLEFFPADEFRAIVQALNEAEPSRQMFEYSPAEGHPDLRFEVRRFLAAQGMEAGEEELLIVSGSQQAIDLVSRTMVDPGDDVVIEDPTYFWANCTFRAVQARCIPAPVDELGLRLDALESILKKHRAKLLYLMPTFQNPTGATMPLERRVRLLELARRFNLAVLEDNFVGGLRYQGEFLPTLRALDSERDTVIHQGTFSKALCPGLRLGWLVAPAEVTARLTLAKKSCDLSTNSLAQAVMAEYLRRGHYSRHLEIVREAYGRRRDAMVTALERHLRDRAGWRRPEGGLFLWAWLPHGCSSRELLAFAEREGVTFSPGDIFFVGGDRSEYLRLSFIQLPPRLIEEGISRLGRAVSAYLSSRERSGKTEHFSSPSELSLI